MFDAFTEYVERSPWIAYPYLFGVSALDVLVPLVPSETSVILGGVVAGTGGLDLGLVILFAAAGAIVGDNIAYWIGRTAGHRLVERFLSQGRRKQVEWAHRQVEERGGYLIVIGRFIPGGRTAVTLSCGMLEMRWRRFLAFDVLAGLVWGTYAAMLGYLGGRTFEENPLRGFLLAFAVALAVAGAIELYRWIRKRRVVARG
ncbi:MAG TPA: DedA family protein [Gaiellaceae bacterium]|nr:DedA family protein [Gaiellaceae bacterium]